MVGLMVILTFVVFITAGSLPSKRERTPTPEGTLPVERLRLAA